MKKTVSLFCLTVILVLMLCGCRVIRIEEEERKALEYTVVSQEEIPKEVITLIEGKKGEGISDDVSERGGALSD